MNEGNTEGTRKSRDSVTTGRETSASMEDLKEVCLAIPHVRNLAKHYSVTVPEMTTELKRQGILRHTRTEDVDWSDLEAKYQEAGTMPALARVLGTTEKITYGELVRRGIQQRRPGHVKGQKKSDAWREASAEHWDDPAWREEQRQKWLERLPGMRGTGSTSPLEQLLHEALQEARISFATHQPFFGKYIVDVLITQKPVIVEADGSSHLLRAAREKDARRDADFRENGYEVVRITYREIADDVDGCVQRLIRTAGLTVEDEPTFVISSDAEAKGALSRQRWSDPERRSRHTAALTGAQRSRRHRERQKQMMVQSGLHEPREDVQRPAETTGPGTLF
jgi:very-short-patch-repair endonuclease